MAIIRKAAVKDLGTIQKIAKESWNDTYRGLIPEDIQERFLGEAYADELMPVRLERTLLLVAENDGKLVGFANASQKEGIGNLHAIYLLPVAKGRGIGSQLLESLFAELGPIREMHVEVEKGNKSGETFYTAKGFKMVAEFTENLYGHTLTTKKMVLELAN
jgi:GNAT superfamily N-acetyltransferase